MLQEIKDFIKTNQYFKGVYAKFQCMIVQGQYRLIQFIYKFKFDKTSTFRSSNKLIIENLNIFYFGGDELQDKSGFLQAISKYATVTYFTKDDESYGSYNFGVMNRRKNIHKNGKRLLELLSSMNTKPNILLMQTWEWRIGLATLRKVRELYPQIKIVNIAMDDRHSYWIYGNKKIGSAGLIPMLDAVFTTSSEAVEWYKKEGCPAYFYPLASDKELFKPLSLEKKYDIGFVGAKYGIRETIVNLLIDASINVKAYGNGWESGRLPIDDTNKFYNECKIVLGVGTILGCNNFVSMKLRDFDVPMSGSLYITNYNKDTANIFKDGEEILFYKTPQECVVKVKNLLLDNNKMNGIREKALQKAYKHTYELRISKMLKQLGYAV